MYDINKDNFKEKVLDQNGLVIVDFKTEWCSPCRMLEPVLRDLDQELKDVQFFQIDIDNQKDLAAEYRISSIPCIIFFKDGVEKSRTLGYKNKEYLKNIIKGL